MSSTFSSLFTSSAATSSVSSPGSNALSLASLINSGASAYASYQASNIKSELLKLQGRQHENQARQERIKGVQQSNILREQLLSNLSSVNAMFGASGVDVGSLSARALANRNTTTSRRDQAIVESNAEIMAIGSEAQAMSKRSAAKSEKISGRNAVAQQIFGETNQRAIGSLLGGI